MTSQGRREERRDCQHRRPTEWRWILLVTDATDVESHNNSCCCRGIINRWWWRRIIMRMNEVKNNNGSCTNNDQDEPTSETEQHNNCIIFIGGDEIAQLTLNSFENCFVFSLFFLKKGFFFFYISLMNNWFEQINPNFVFCRQTLYSTWQYTKTQFTARDTLEREQHKTKEKLTHIRNQMISTARIDNIRRKSLDPLQWLLNCS